MISLTGLSITAIVAAAAALFSQVRQVFRHVAGLFLLQTSIVDGMCFPIGSYIRSTHWKLPSGITVIRGLLGNIDGAKRNVYIPYELPTQTSVWRGPHGTFIISGSSGKLNLVSLRFFSNPKELVKAGLQFQNKLMDEAEDGMGNFYVRQITGTAGEMDSYNRSMNESRVSSSGSDSPVSAPSSDNTWVDIDTRIDKSFMYEPHQYVQNKSGRDPLHGLFFDPEVHELIDQLKYWFKQREWYEQRNIPWRTGVLAYGPGGTGKSSLARATAEILGIPLYQFYLNTLRDREFMDEWDRMQTPCVVALEDFDTVFHGREPVTVHKSLSFECVLNKISGISSLNGVLLFTTTNHLEHIDPALGQMDENGMPTRPGRIDHILHLSYTSPAVRNQIAKHILGGWADNLIADLIKQDRPMTAAQFQNQCIQVALKHLRMATRNSEVLERHKEKHAA